MDYWGFDTDTATVLYDFTKNIGDTVYTGAFEWNIIAEIDSIPVSEGYRKRFKTEYGEEWIEGIGSTRGFLFPMTMRPTMFWYTQLVCFKHNDEVIYLNPDFSDCTTRIVSSVKDAGLRDDVEVYPNPVEKGQLVSVKASKSPISKIQLYNQSGELVSVITYPGKNEILLDTRGCLPGVYLLRIVNSNRDISLRKIVVK
jgi:hypothetical protein